jgi:hypothetical protein
MLIGAAARLPIAWNLELWPLLRGEARLHVAPYAGTAKGPPRADVRLHGNGFSVRDAEVVVPAPMWPPAADAAVVDYRRRRRHRAPSFDDALAGSGQRGSCGERRD